MRCLVVMAKHKYTHEKRPRTYEQVCTARLSFAVGARTIMFGVLDLKVSEGYRSLGTLGDMESTSMSQRQAYEVIQ